MNTAVRTAAGIPLTLIGMTCFIVFMWKGLWAWVDYGDIAASVVSLFSVFIGGVLVHPLGRRVGENVTVFGFMGAFLAGLFAYLTLSGPKGGVVDIGELLMFLVCGTLAAISLAVMVFGLGILSGALIIPTKGERDSKTTPPATDAFPDEPSEE